MYYGFGWGWLFWIAMCFMLFSNVGNWRYTYRAHRKYRDLNLPKSAADILDERYARGEITKAQYHEMKFDLFGTDSAATAATSVSSTSAQ